MVVAPYCGGVPSSSPVYQQSCPCGRYTRSHNCSNRVLPHDVNATSELADATLLLIGQQPSLMLTSPHRSQRQTLLLAHTKKTSPLLLSEIQICGRIDDVYACNGCEPATSSILFLSGQYLDTLHASPKNTHPLFFKEARTSRRRSTCCRKKLLSS